MRLFVVRCILIAVLAGCFCGTALAEVAMQPKKGVRGDLIVMAPVSITDGVDPIPQMWDRFRPISDDYVLNADGADRGDGRPDISRHPETGRPTVVWAYNRGEQHDIAISSWNGERWSEPEFLTNSLENELDPRAFVTPNGKIHVVWWVSSPDPRVVLMTRTPDTQIWQPTLRISPLGESGRRPTVAVYDGVTRVAYERDGSIDTFNMQEIAVYRGGPTGMILEHVFAAQWTEPLDPLLHVGADRLWLDWKHSPAAFGFTQLAASPVWTETTMSEWTDPSWIGQETTRREIAKLVSLNQLLVSQN